jgi:hypothetical protein
MTTFFSKIVLSIVFVCFLTLGSTFLSAQRKSPFAIPGRAPPPKKTLSAQLPQTKKIIPQVKTLPSPYDLRGCYQFEGKWYFALYHKSTRESAWLSWEQNSTAVNYAGDVFIFDPEGFQVTHESSNPQVAYESIDLAEASKATGAAFNPSAPKATKSSKTPQPSTRQGKPRGLVVPSPKKK